MGRASWISARPCLTGVVHLGALPGAPRHRSSMAELVRRATADARAYAKAGFDAVVVENYGDAPFYPERVPAETIAALAVACAAVRDAVRLPVGVNCLRNDALGALAVGAACELDFLRVNVLSGVVVADQGFVAAQAHEVARARARLRPSMLIFADVRVKHSAPIAPRPIEEETADLVERCGADVVIVSGGRTGAPPDVERLRAVRRAAGSAPVWIGSGLDAARAESLFSVASGAIVGTSIKRGGITSAPVDVRRASKLAAACRRARPR